jgi:two-component system response regulator DegU
MEVLTDEKDSHPSKGPRITVLLADDHPVVREGMQRILERQPDLTVIGGVGTASDAIIEAGRLKPRIVVMDITMPGMNGIEATRVLVHEVPHT